MVHKALALVLAGAMIAGGISSCVRPVRAAAVDDTAVFAEYLDTLANIATGGGTLPTGALPVLAAQYALVYAYSQAGAGANAVHGQGFSCAGLTTYQGVTYLGGGYCNDTATAMGFRITHSNADGGQTVDTTITGKRYLNDPAYTERMYRGDWTVNISGDSPKYMFSIEGGPTTMDFNGEPVGGLLVGYHSGGSSYITSYNGAGYASYVVFYAGGYDFSTGFSELSGTSLPDDMTALHIALHQQYPEVENQYYLDWDYDPGGGGSGCNCNCNVTVNVEPSINVEVNVEPTINVDVDVENPLPSEWLETLPEETTENPIEELPTLEVENFTDVLQEPDEILGENSGFWWECLKRWVVDNDKVWKYLLGLFTIAVIGSIIRGLK